MHGACDSVAWETVLCPKIVARKAGDCAMGACDKTTWNEMTGEERMPMIASGKDAQGATLVDTRHQIKKLDDDEDRMHVAVSEEDPQGSTLVDARQQMEKLDDGATCNGVNDACEVTSKKE